MFKKFARGLSAIAMTGVLLGAEPTQACCLLDWCSCFKPKPTTYCPPPPVAVCPQQVSYVPQTCGCAPAPCPCQPVSACDPCGGATVMQASYVPRTTLRPVVTPLTYGAAYSSPYYSGMPTSSCPTCGGGGTTVGYAAPASATVPVSASAGYSMPAYATQPTMTPSYAAQPQMGQPYAAQPQMAPSYAAQPQMADPNMGSQGMSAPSLGSPTPAAPPVTAPNTFQPSSTMPQSNSSLMPTAPIPDNNSGAPRLLDPQTRTTSAHIIGPANVTHAVFNTADRSHVFRAIGYQPSNNRAAASNSDGWSGNADNWQSGEGR